MEFKLIDLNRTTVVTALGIILNTAKMKSSKAQRKARLDFISAYTELDIAKDAMIKQIRKDLGLSDAEKAAIGNEAAALVAEEKANVNVHNAIVEYFEETKVLLPDYCATEAEFDGKLDELFSNAQISALRSLGLLKLED